METICCDPSSDHLVKMVQIRGHNICFYTELTKMIPNYPHILPLISSSVKVQYGVTIFWETIVDHKVFYLEKAAYYQHLFDNNNIKYGYTYLALNKESIYSEKSKSDTRTFSK